MAEEKIENYLIIFIALSCHLDEYKKNSRLYVAAWNFLKCFITTFPSKITTVAMELAVNNYFNGTVR